MRKFTETEQVAETEGDHTESLKKLDVAAIENPVIVDAVQEKLDAVYETEEETAVSDEKDEDSTSDEIKDDSDAQESGQTESQTNSDDTTPEAETKDGEVNIPDAYIRAAIHRGWTQEVVDDFVKSNPKLALKALEATYLEVNNASRDWSERGRADIEAERAKATQAATKAVVQEDPTMVAKVAALRKEYPDDPLIEVIITDLEKKAKPVQQPQPVPQAQQHYEVATARATAAGNLAIDQRVNSFFGADTMKPYEKFYGKLELGQIPEDLSNGQQLNRLSVLQEAEFIIAGHNSRGQKIEVGQALEKAHFIVTEPIRQQVIRDNLKATATKRKKSMTLRPSDSKRSSDSMRTESSKPRNKAELEQSVQINLDKVFKK